MTDSYYNDPDFLKPEKENKSNTPLTNAAAYYVTKKEGPTGDIIEEVVPASLSRSFEADDVWDLEKDAWQQVKDAAADSNWIPKEYCMNEWLADICRFLRYGPLI